ncbi:hypothetical protein DYU05_10640 [Mucilaginibacter terrenus]|uniref:Uncharacterized protein n=1 Tax=Mucilaginibacter terrenus TaxID=2482727 RepID=A0A3E2NNP4_9SPHI|nr:hypothetical protein DYU05_10640 [Mucilaginibacter terrenus]
MIADDHSQADNQSNIKQIRLNGQSTTNAVLNHLVEAGYPAVNIIADELDIAATEQYGNSINIVWFCHDEKVFPIRSGFKKWKPKGEQIRVLSDTSTLEFEGLERVAPNIYSTTADGFYSFTFHEPLLFIAEQII